MGSFHWLTLNESRVQVTIMSWRYLFLMASIADNSIHTHPMIFLRALKG